MAWTNPSRWFAAALTIPLTLLGSRAFATDADQPATLQWETAPATPDQPGEANPAPTAAAPESLPGGTSTSNDQDPRALTQFRTELAPYGRWVDDPTYGTVWVPNVPADFGPYSTAGHWDLDAAGNMVWVSDYPWGNIAFHYGRWAWVAGVGWEWIPGYQWAPAWVDWSLGIDPWGYVGWAPLFPTFCWHGGFAVGLGFVGPAWFFYVPRGFMFRHDLHHFLVRDHALGARIAAHSFRATRAYAVQTPRGTARIGGAYGGGRAGGWARSSPAAPRGYAAPSYRGSRSAAVGNGVHIGGGYRGGSWSGGVHVNSGFRGGGWGGGVHASSGFRGGSWGGGSRGGGGFRGGGFHGGGHR